MIRINLLPVKEIEAEVTRRQELLFAGLLLGGMLAVLGGLYWFQTHKISGLEKDLQDIRQEIIKLNAEIKEVAELQKKVAEFKGKHKVIEELRDKRTGPVQVMESLVSVTPARLWLTDFKEFGGHLTLAGMAVDNQTIADFLKALAAQPYFRDVELIESVQTDRQGLPFKRFTIKSNLLYRTPAAAPQPPAQPAGKAG
jgi:type IV pilus assembly protein PilN